MGRVRLTLVILVSVIGVAGLYVCAITQDRWLGVLDLTIRDRGGGGDSIEHVWALHNGIYFDVEFHHEWESRSLQPWNKGLGDRYLHQRGGVMPSKDVLPISWGFSRATVSDLISMGNQYDSATQCSFPVWPIFVLCLLPALIAPWIASRRRAARLRGECIQCHYNLKGNSSGVCPECGTRIYARWE